MDILKDHAYINFINLILLKILNIPINISYFLKI